MEDVAHIISNAIIKNKCETEHLFFTRYFFKQREGFKFKVNWHHYLFGLVVDNIISGKWQNVLVNVSPASSKTQELVIDFMARGLAINPRAKFLHLTYSDTLASLNSQSAREIVKSEEFQNKWPLKIATDDKAKARWNIVYDNRKAGGVYATPLGGQITGFRGGRMEDGFQGAIIIDDPIKPTDALSKVKRDEANNTLVNTVKSRKARPTTPVLLVMQRLHQNDCSGFILDGGLDEFGDWIHINIPVEIDDAWIEENRELIGEDIISKINKDDKDETDGMFSYWPFKEPLELIKKMKASVGMAAFTFWSQYKQKPRPLGGGLFKQSWFGAYDIHKVPQLKYRFITADTAQKTKEHNDFSVFSCWGVTLENKLALIDVLRGKWEAPDLEKAAIGFWSKHKIQNSYWLGNLRDMKVEDKSSGTGLIQSLRGREGIIITAIQRNTDKLTRAMDAAPSVEAGKVLIPLNAHFIGEFLSEITSFSADMSHDHDDQTDTLIDAVNETFNLNGLSVWQQLADQRTKEYERLRNESGTSSSDGQQASEDREGAIANSGKFKNENGRFVIKRTTA